MNISNISKNGLSLNENGIWFSNENRGISYPESGNEILMQIEENSYWFKHRRDCILTSMETFKPQEPFFDIGGGNGYISIALQEEKEVVLLEPGIEGALNGQRRGLKNIICSTLEDAKLNKGTLSSVGLFDVLEHIENDVEFLESIKELMVKDGFIYITVPAYNFLWSNEDDLACHHRRYTLQMLISRLQKAGFKISYATYIFSILVVPIFLFRTLISKIPLTKKKQLSSEDTQKEHDVSGVLKRIFKLSFMNELKKIKSNKSVSFGGSCLVVAKA